MKKSLTLSAFVIALFILVATVPFAGALTRGTALLVHGTADGVLEGDRGVADKLTSYGFDVDIMLAVDCGENTWVDYDIIYIGESVMSADVGTKFTEADCVVIVSEPGNYDELLMGNYDIQYDAENIYSKGSYIVVNDIVNCGLSEFEGFSSEEVAPGFLLEWGAGGVVVVENENGSPAVTVFSPGSELFDRSSALNYRIQWFFRGQDAVHATDDAWKVFESVINYVIPLPVPEETVAETIAEAETVTTETTAAAQTSDTVMILSFIVAAAAIPVLKKRK